MFSNLKIGLRLSIGFGIVLVLLGVIAAGGAYQLAQLNASMDSVVNDKYRKAALASEISVAAMDNAVLVRNMVLVADKDKLDVLKS